MADRGRIARIGPEKLAIFVSSTIKECAVEREAAKRAITSINHRSLLFERLGAREHPPRRFYYNLIQEAKIFIGIYRSKYGWIAPKFAISGIEDELLIASSRGMPRLIYVHADAAGRDPRLTALIERFKESAEFTISFYQDVDELESRIRDDLTATISDGFLNVPVPARSVDDAEAVLGGVATSGLSEVIRNTVIDDIEQALESGSLNVFGPLGSGKTVLLARLSELKNYTFVNCADLTPTEALAKCALQLRASRGEPIGACEDVPSAKHELQEAAFALGQFTLLVDGCVRPDFVVDALAGAGGPSDQMRLCFSSRTPFPGHLGKQLLVPPFDENEVRTATNADGPEIERLIDASSGNPLYLRFLVASGGHLESSLFAYELRVIKQLPFRAQELCKLAAISEEPLSLEDLHEMIGSEESVEETAELINQTQGLIVRRGSVFVLFHDHLRETLRRDLELNAPLRGLYANRLASRFMGTGRYLSAFGALSFAGSADVESVIARAAFQAAMQGDVARGARVFEKQVELAKQRSDVRLQGQALLQLSQLLEITGNIEESRSRLAEAARIVGTSNDAELVNLVEERIITMEARTVAPQIGVEKLIALRNKSSDEGDEWTAARMTLEISALHIRNDDFERAVIEARKALVLFEEIKDEYGVDLAKRNLASACVASESPETEKEGYALLREFEQKEMGPTLREKAWRLNVRARQARSQDAPDVAAELSQEAAEIGKELGDLGVAVINTINLGNALRDLRKIDEAIRAYGDAADMSAQAGDLRNEAQAAMLIAKTHEEVGHHVEARKAALLAIARAKASGSHRIAARAGEQLGDALVGMGEKSKASEAYIDAAKAARVAQGDLEFLWRVLILGLTILVEDNSDESTERYLTVLEEFLGPVASPEEREALRWDEIAIFQAIELSRQCPTMWIVKASAMHRTILLRDIPEVLAARAVSLVVERGLRPGEKPETFASRALASVVYLCAVPPQLHSRFTLVRLSEFLARSVAGLHFRPSDDGAASWTLRLDTDPPVIVSLRQLDDRPDTFMATWIIAAVFKSLENRLQQAILSNAGIMQHELSIWVSNESEVRDQIDIASQVFGEALEEPCAVTRPTRFEQGALTTTFVLCRDDISKLWANIGVPGNSVEILMAYLLSEVAFQLYEGEIDLEVLRPKIVQVIGHWLR